MNPLAAYLVIDTETTGLFDFKAPADAPGQPRMASASLLYLDEALKLLDASHHLIKPDGWEMPEAAAIVNKLTTAILTEHGVPVRVVLEEYVAAIDAGVIVVAHNAQFDLKVFRAELRRASIPDRFEKTKNICTMRACTDICAIKGPRGNKFPKLSEAAAYFSIAQVEAHTAKDDAHVCVEIFRKLVAAGKAPEPNVYFAKEAPAPR